MKTKLKLLAVLLIPMFLFSCLSDDYNVNNNSSKSENQNELLQKKTELRETLCDVQGPHYVTSNQLVTFTYDSDIQDVDITWTSSPSGAFTFISQSGNTATFRANSGFSTGFIQAVGIGVETCSDTLKVNISGGGSSGDYCGCPRPVIEDRLCVSGGHPHWRFQVNGVRSDETVTWSINHGTVLSNPTSEYVIIQPNSGSVAGFTVYCRVVRTCDDGSQKVRTAYYTNYYGNDCGTGTTGYIGTCSGGLGEIEAF